MTKNERLIIAVALAVAVTNFLFMGMGLLYHVCLLAVLVVGVIGMVRWFQGRSPAGQH
ncbi:hypothetical protein [Arthrobacter sp. RIT-PI-e]|uniref:hypothetical protein n=1 Tax=Arthrobacter sp. RIT-PI-e TaxID=1681197 RepID=UPI000AC52D0E|nr:hypothetical protein [Arthrobacter sp. RIT-PI-e]